MKKLMFAADTSLSTSKAVNTVKKLLTAWPDAQLLVVHITDTSAPVDAEEYTLAKQTGTRMAKQIEQLARAEWFPEFADRIEVKHLFGMPAIAIAMYAEEQAVDLLILGHRASGPTDHLLTGSVSHGVLYCAHVPVLFVGDEERAFAHAATQAG
ncbi:MAG: universal stress protein [Alicyclobacillus sp.]|nr:universal stress protein [Alicyclobacillus sp.]